MAYLVNQTNGTLLTTVLDGAVDRTHAGIALVGKKVTNYGEIQNENYVRITENFSSPASPVNPLEGQLWWNNTSNTLSVFDGAVWVSVGTWNSIPASAVGKTGDKIGLIAFDTSFLYVCTGTYDGTTSIWTRTHLSTVW